MTEEERQDPDMYLITAYVASGGKLVRESAYLDEEERVVFVVKGSSDMFSKVENDWYAPDGETTTFPCNILKRYKVALQDVKALMHSVKGSKSYGSRSQVRAN